MKNKKLIVRQLGLTDYDLTWQAMKAFTVARLPEACDEVWLLEHHPVFTQGQNGKPEHVLDPGNIPIVQTDRGGQITYHGPGQLMVYTLFDLKRLGMGIREFVSALENCVIDVLAENQIKAISKRDAPGVYVDEKKICSIGLRVKKGCSYHGLAFNINMDLSPFARINPCGYLQLKMTQTSELGGPQTVSEAGLQMIRAIQQQFGFSEVEFLDKI